MEKAIKQLEVLRDEMLTAEQKLKNAKSKKEAQKLEAHMIELVNKCIEIIDKEK